MFLGGAPADAGFQVYDCDLDSGRIAKLTRRAVPRVPAQRRRRAHAALPQPRGLGLDARRDPAAAARAAAARADRIRATGRGRAAARANAAPPAARARRADPPAPDAPPAEAPRHAGTRPPRRRRPAAAQRRRRRDERHPDRRRRHAGEPDRSPVHPAASTGRPHGRRARRPRSWAACCPAATGWIATAGRSPATTSSSASRPRRRLVRLLEPAARAADAVAGGVVSSRSRTSRPSSTSDADHAVRLHAAPARAASSAFDARAPVLRQPGVARLRVRRELAPRRSGRAAAAAAASAGPHLSAAYRAPRRRRTPARAGCSSRRSTRPPTRSLELRRLRLLRPARRGGRHRAAAVLPAPHADCSTLRGRDLAGAPAGERMLRVGGYVCSRSRAAPGQPETDPRPTTRSFRRARCSSNRCAASRTIRSRSIGSRSAARPTGCRSSSTTAGRRRSGCCRRCSSGRSTSSCSRSRPATARTRRQPHRRRRLAVAAPRVLGRPDHRAVPARPPLHRRSGAGRTWSQIGSADDALARFLGGIPLWM